jgi:hypothetical protein
MCRRQEEDEEENKKKIKYNHYIAIIIPCSRVSLEKLTLPHLVRNFHAFYGSQDFIRPVVTVKAGHLSLS